MQQQQKKLFAAMDFDKWLALGLCGFTPRQLASCSVLGLDGLCAKDLSLHHLRQLGVRPQTAERWVAYLAGESTVARALERSLNWFERHPEAHFIHCVHPLYPPLLEATHSPPFALYVRGKADILRQPSVAIVGARGATSQGKRNAALFAEAFAEAGLVVISGLAIGIDTASHQAALKVGTTIAVVGTGVDSTYPRQNQALAEVIADKGAVVSEFALGSRPLPGHFPRRNRIISGMSLGVLVVEASCTSGSLLTVGYALDANRDVFAVPGPIASPLSVGCHKLIKQGAGLAEHPLDVLEALSYAKSYRDVAATTQPSLSPELQDVLHAVSYSMSSVDSLCQQTELDAARVNSALIALELEGYVEKVAGGYTRLPTLD